MDIKLALGLGGIVGVAYMWLRQRDHEQKYRDACEKIEQESRHIPQSGGEGAGDEGGGEVYADGLAARATALQGWSKRSWLERALVAPSDENDSMVNGDINDDDDDDFEKEVRQVVSDVTNEK